MKLSSTDKKTILCVFIIIILIITNAITVSRCSVAKYNGDNNINALTDSIRYFKTTNGTLAAQKTMLVGDLHLLKHVNDSLYKIVKGLGVKSPDNVVYTKITISDTKHDTVWVTKRDSSKSDKNNYIYNINKKFDFSDNYRTLTGQTWFRSNGVTDSLGLVIDTNSVTADFTVVQKNNNVYITSNNPYVKYNNIIGLTRSKKKRFGIGLIVGVGINHKAQIGPYAGVGLTYNIFSF